MKKLIYLVDDEPMVLEVCAWTVRSFDEDWDVRTFARPDEAFQAVKVQHPHLILTDQKMPGMTGTELLDLVRQESPESIRILVTGFAQSLDKILAAHQYFPKPFPSGDMKWRIRCALAAQELLSNADLRRVVASLRSFPVVPEIYFQLLAALDQDTASLDVLADLVSKDGGSLTRIIQLANSPLFGRQTSIIQAQEAIMQLGTGNIKPIVLSLHVFSAYENLQIRGFSVPALWHHSWEAAHLAKSLCEQAHMEKEQADQAFFAGLIHDLGLLVLLENCPRQFQQACAEAEQTKTCLEESETRVFGVSHAEISAFMLRLWGIPDAVVEAVTDYRAPWAKEHAKFSISDALYMANILTRMSKSPDSYVTDELDQQYLTRMGAPQPTKAE